MHEKLNEAMNEISDRHLSEAVQFKRSRVPMFSAIAAVLALAILASILWPAANSGTDPTQPSINLEQPTENTSPDPTESTVSSPEIQLLAGQISAPVYPTMAAYPASENGRDYSQDDYMAWLQSRNEQHNQPEGYADNLNSSFAQMISAFFADKENENAACSPLNIYMALAMLAETTAGDSQAQILELLNADNMEALRTQAGHVWNAHYCADGATTSILANSLWLDEGLTYDPATVSILSQQYYASLFRGNLGSEEMNQSLRDWLNAQTQGLLQEQAQDVTLDPNTVLALASTICYRAKWNSEFSEKNNTQSIFHAPSGETACTFMNRTEYYGIYYYGEDYSAVRLRLEDGSNMWLVLPDEGHTPRSVLQSGNAVNAILLDENVQSVSIRVNLSLPKFDIVSDTDLAPMLQSLGVTDVFDINTSDFSPILPEDTAYLDKVEHAARVAIDEEGVTAAAYTVLAMAGNAEPPEDEVDFVLDRPFLFLITSRDELPLFSGIVNEP